MRVESSQMRSKWTANRRVPLKWVSLSNIVYALLTLVALVLFMQDAQASTNSAASSTAFPTTLSSALFLQA